MSTLMWVLALVLVIVLIGIGPILTILSLNALFATGIAITIWNWLAVVWLSLIGVGIVSTGVRQGR